MRVDLFDYELPPELIAQHPTEEREQARLMGLGEVPDACEHRRVADLPDLLPPGSLVVVNDTRVIPARLLGRKHDTGGRAEIFLVRSIGPRELEVTPGNVRVVEIWHGIGKASKPLRFDSDIDVAPRDGAPLIHLIVRLLGRTDDGLLELGIFTRGGEPVQAGIRACGRVPLPPYVKREDEGSDAERYQTVYARHDGAVAAPTAGLHMTHALLGRLAVRGCEITSVTLHVGLGTFQSVQVDDLDEHAMHAERYVISQSTADAIARARARNARLLAVGTTTVRALESAADPERTGCVVPGSGETRLLIQPGYSFRVVDMLLTNFHLPRSTLLALVCAFGGRERVLDAYRRAIREGYRFFSYGDAMLVGRGD
ncbi:MAG: tRNA preQ1(34) S-adenosylmethionine ribosyltransferase-isomerase QueA [Polyangiaceae bacterium]|jgi:S-adenosylmethionine:tRNA ribosyltransferase-isomerase